MPNHLHVILFLPNRHHNLNKIISNGKRFIAYEIIGRLENDKQHGILDVLYDSVSKRERRKGQKHKVFIESFDAKPIYTDAFLQQKINYIHYNPVRGKWKLVEDYTLYPHSSALFYETGKAFHFEPRHYKICWKRLRSAGSRNGDPAETIQQH